MDSINNNRKLFIIVEEECEENVPISVNTVNVSQAGGGKQH